DDATADIVCDPDFDGATFIEAVPFDNDGTSDSGLEQVASDGHDARLYTDLRDLDVGALVNDNDSFYIRTEFPDLLDDTSNWELRIRGLVDETEIALADLMDLVEDQGNLLLECSGNGNFGNMGLLSSAEWSGVPMQAIFDRVDIDSSATRVLVSGFDERSQVSTHSSPGASWIFTFDDLADAGAFLATHMNGEPLPPDHGEPV
ncbi:MAG: molybdopterin-dependent oxidoreductase, partial [Proteobacteria bacterium]|nr:molybdopterin-dependent oxidoreductase [Pseudomonadota bacterium]